MKRYAFVFLFSAFLIPLTVNAQSVKFTRQDTLRGSITPERAWWDLTYYHLAVTVNPDDSTLTGFNTVRYRVESPASVMQIDLQEPLAITRITQDGRKLKFRKDGNAWFVNLRRDQIKGEINEIVVHYSGKPQVSQRPPWSGGVTWKKDSSGSPFIVTTCQGDGASLWWPCKDHQYDEPDSMLISVTVPQNLTDVSNGRLRDVVRNNDGTRTFNWFVSSPINNYCVNLNIADYAHFSRKFAGEKGELECDYYVLKENLEKAKTYFNEADRVLAALEHWFGPYPFYEDGYKLVEVPYPGMEHQSSVTYGNGYRFGYGGNDVSGSGWGAKFDFIIEHESSHEWFGNNITSKDIADMWVHESFGAYSESLFVDYHYGKQAGNEYCIGTRKNIGNRSPIVGQYDVNHAGSGDMYSKGANMLHTLRQWVDDDEKFRGMLRGLNRDFYHKTVTGAQVEAYLAKATGFDLTRFFDQYLRDIRIPTLEYSVTGTVIKHRWTHVIDGFDMPIRIFAGDKAKWIRPTPEWKESQIPENVTVEVDPGFYVKTSVILQ